MNADSRVFAAVAGEDAAHFYLLTRLADLTLLEKAAGGWPAADELDLVRVWRGLKTDAQSPAADPNRPQPLPFYSLRNAQHDRPRRFSALRRGDQALGRWAWVKKVYQTFADQQPAPQVLLLAVDTDARQNCMGEITPVLEAVQGGPVQLLVAVAHREAEAWYVAALGQCPRPEVVQVLGFDPVAEPERLTVKARDPKKVLRYLLGEGDALDAAPSETLPKDHYRDLAEKWRLAELEKHQGCGLAAFIEQLRARWVPLCLRSV